MEPSQRNKTQRRVAIVYAVILMALAVLHPSIAFSQTDTLYYPADSLKAIGRLRDGKKFGPWTLFYWNGQRQSTGEFYDNQPINSWTNWQRDGRLLAVASYDSSGRKHGTIVEYNYRVPETIEVAYVHGKIHGPAIWRHLDGHVIIKGHYDSDQRSGQWIWSWPSGIVQAIGEMKDDTFQGTWSYYHENGSLDCRGRFSRGQKTGSWSFYYPSGVRKKKGMYRHDKMNGTWLYYSEHGDLLGKVRYIDGLEK